MAALSSRTRLAALALGAWTLATWVTRLPLAWGDDELGAGEKVVAAVPVVLFVTLASVAGVAVLRRAERAGPASAVLAGWSVAYWVVRLPMILLHDHPVPFYVVHTVLAVVAFTLSGLILVRLAGDGVLPLVPGRWSWRSRRRRSLRSAPGDVVGPPPGR